MTLEATYDTLAMCLQSLQDDLVGLQTIIREDKPIEVDIVSVDIYSDAIDTWLGWLAEMHAAVMVGRQAVGPQVNLDQAWRALATCQMHFIRLEYGYFDLISYERMDPFMRFGRSHQGERRTWVNSVKEMFDQCQHPLYSVHEALFQCWQGVAERVGTLSISIHSTNIGQQIA